MEFLDVLGIDVGRTAWDWGSWVGHVGAGDQIGGLDHLVRAGALRPGDRVVLASSGMGFNWNAVVMEII